VKPENKKKFDELVKEIEKVKTQYQANKKLLKPAEAKFKKMAKDLGISLVSEKPSNKVPINGGTIQFTGK